MRSGVANTAIGPVAMSESPVWSCYRVLLEGSFDGHRVVQAKCRS